MSERPQIPPFQAFFEAHRTLVYRFLLASVGPDDAEDCFQETFLSALRAYPKLANAENLRAWVLQIAANKAIDSGRSRARRPTPLEEVPEPRPREGTGDGRSGGRQGSFDPADPLWAAVRALPERMRTAVVLRHVMDRPYDEVAGVMGGNEEGARANVHQGLKRLRAVLDGPALAAAEREAAR
jgi:RNA polymerase sigma factor (sigma-70 family)